MAKDPGFPAPEYAETVLAINFGDAQRYFLDALVEIQYAHVLMLARQKIIPDETARACLEALDGLDLAALRAARYTGQHEDLFFYMEEALTRACGPENAGAMHTARSRNDIAITQYRMALRRELLALIRAAHNARSVLVRRARENIETIMPAYTHTQPAQPTTLAHYLLAVIELLDRDIRRMMAAFATVNRSPMGACAITTTGFPIDREWMARSLGFEGLQWNSYGAIAATDYLTETAASVATATINLGKVAQDLLLWSTAEFGYLRLPDAWVQISSIMPQKRNPVPLEHMRVLASKALAQAQGVLATVHNTPFGDIVDTEDDLQPLVMSMMADALRAIRLLAGTMQDCEINKGRMAERARADFLSVTELADTLVRGDGLSFRQAHHLVSEAVRRMNGHFAEDAMVDCVTTLAPAVIGRPLHTPRAELVRALDPEHFVTIRKIAGGPAPEAVKAALAHTEKEAAADARWIEEKTGLLEEYRERIRTAHLGSVRH
ncbi:MAG: argininosuccinate lyase [Acidobacteriia bacterium]|nr:argininosuccinate lyase [Terriglobia bacterium]MBV9743236.1 argininosuccinate lyase [Terriglobia bacterium]